MTYDKNFSRDMVAIVLGLIILISIWGLAFDFKSPYAIPKNDCDNICLESNGDGWYSIKQIGNISDNTSRYCNIKNCQEIGG